MAGSQQERQPPTAIWNADDGRSRNLSTGLMRPLYTSCREHHHAQERYRQSCSHPSNNGGIVKNTSSSKNDGPSPSQRRPRFLTLNSLPRMPSTSPESKRTTMGSSFVRLPTEIRLQIYSLLVLPQRRSDILPSFQKISSSAQDYYDYDGRAPKDDEQLHENGKNSKLHIRTIDPDSYRQRYEASDRKHVRSCYSVRADRFRARCMKTTYHCVNNPRTEDNMGILRVNRQIHDEAAELLYSSYIFDFDTHVEAVIPFLADLTPFARGCIKGVRIVKRALPYLKEFDKCEWSNALRYLTNPHSNINLRRLELGVVAGRPGPNGWDRIAKYSANDFGLVAQMEGMEWMQYLFEFEGLQELDVHPVIEHCPPVTSSTGMANYVRFSASVEEGFAEFMKNRLLAKVPEVHRASVTGTSATMGTQVTPAMISA